METFRMRLPTHGLAGVLAVVGCAAILSAVPAPARAETTACTPITALPAYISEPGHYCLDQDFDYTAIGAPFNVQADNVVLDCNHHRITNTGHPGEYTAIYVSFERKDVTVRNCTIDAFGGGIFVQSGSEPGSTGNLIEGNTVLRSGSYGIYVIGSNNRIERNRVSGNTGGINGQATGIEVSGFGSSGASNAIRDNVVGDFKPAKNPSFNFTVIGIAFSNVNNTEVTGNTVTGLYAPTDRHVEGIVSQGTAHSIVANNTVLSPPPLGAPYDGAQSYGIIIYGAAAGNVCRDNVVGHYDMNISGCLDSVNTDF